eukprot:CAMPEP_0203868820 /NCGR_PEP_ID=MMETSP0359-20131031/17342_1 /ASSEMBLY_ACC=CAM_ASM_000338 /TAXON_ID=268821 /ORGANISM="Scrippsiella Hangoei, Strain SHTV-5" /LENGTH=1214 /DNA_ID=CAMNT_0050787323 /DNA_START=57 /DNA_END=3701 /DNA_ORIENTATION=-
MAVAQISFVQSLVLGALFGVCLGEDVCPGAFDVPGYGPVSLIPTGWGGAASPVDVLSRGTLVPHLGGRAYFADECTAGVYDNKQYAALNLLGKTLRYTTDMSGSGCGCNAAFYLVSMQQNEKPSTCNDYYCDANSVCGVACAEIDIQEANQHAWHSTLHSAHDHSGVGVGYGGGNGWNGPRDFNQTQYGAGASCIDTDKAFNVAVSFPVDAEGELVAMEVMLSQEGHDCPLNLKLDRYAGMKELSKALAAGMTPVVSYWSDNTMLWMDGAGTDGQGPCASDDATACSASVRFSGFSVAAIREPAAAARPLAPPLVAPQAPARPPPSTNLVDGSTATPQCPGDFNIRGLGKASLVSAKVNVPGQPSGRVEVRGKSTIVPFMNGRAYFGSECTPGSYDNEQYLGLNLLGQTLRYTTDMSGAGCGCNVALYLVSMRQNSKPSQCGDHYCDANNVCGESCAEIDIQEANQHAWHSTLHSSLDHGGQGVGYGGGTSWDGPRDFGAQEYGPGERCIDTTKPFQVAASFPTAANGKLAAMEVVLTQEGSPCPLQMKIDDYKDMSELSASLAAGMTPVISYWSADDMTWMDGRGADGQGPCAVDVAERCPSSVQFSNFSLAPISKASASELPVAKPTQAPQDIAVCLGSFDLGGYGPVSLVPTGWHANGALFEVVGKGELVPHMGSRAYFANTCTAGLYDHKQYLALNLLGKTLRFMVDLSGAGCGCNAALYLVSMQQNDKPSTCNDYYCDANHVCGVSCAEIDIMEANMYAWHSTLHTALDHSGKGAGYGGGDGWAGPRDFTGAQYSPGGSCIDSSRPFQVAASFPVDGVGDMRAMEVVLTQDGRDCPLAAKVDDYGGMAELSRALAAGMTPVMSYWSANDMLWMDGAGADGQGPCVVDDASACGESVRMYDFAVVDIVPEAVPVELPEMPAETAAGVAKSWNCAAANQDCRSMPCCDTPRMMCHQVNEWWSMCDLAELATPAAAPIDGSAAPATPIDGSAAPASPATSEDVDMDEDQDEMRFIIARDEANGSGASASASGSVGGSGESDGKAAPEDEGTVILGIRVKSSELPSKWGDDPEVTITVAGAQVQGRVVTTKSSVDAVGGAPSGVPVPLFLAAALFAGVLASAAALRKWAPVQAWWHRGASAITAAKARLTASSKTQGSSARPMSLRFGELIQESPLRRRRGDGGVGQAPADDSTHSAGHTRWPSDVRNCQTVS